jgi:hypothetical protein
VVVSYIAELLLLHWFDSLLGGEGAGSEGGRLLEYQLLHRQNS